MATETRHSGTLRTDYESDRARLDDLRPLTADTDILLHRLTEASRKMPYRDADGREGILTPLLENHVLTVLADIRRKRLTGYGSTFADAQGGSLPAHRLRQRHDRQPRRADSWRTARPPDRCPPHPGRRGQPPLLPDAPHRDRYPRERRPLLATGGGRRRHGTRPCPAHCLPEKLRKHRRSLQPPLRLPAGTLPPGGAARPTCGGGAGQCVSRDNSSRERLHTKRRNRLLRRGGFDLQDHARGIHQPDAVRIGASHPP